MERLQFAPYIEGHDNIMKPRRDYAGDIVVNDETGEPVMVPRLHSILVHPCVDAITCVKCALSIVEGPRNCPGCGLRLDRDYPITMDYTTSKLVDRVSTPHI